MSPGRRRLEAVALLVAGYASVATTAVDEPARVDPRWVLANLYEGQTAVSTDLEIEVRIGTQDFEPPEGEASDAEVRSRARAALQGVTLEDADRALPVEFTYDLGLESTFIRPTQPLRPDTRYRFDVAPFAADARSERPIPEIIEFSTRSGPRVTGLWRVEDTLMIAFSEPMDPTTLSLSPVSVDILWKSENGLKSIATDRNLANFVWDTQGEVFRLASVAELQSVLVKVSGDVRGLAGGRLDGDGDGVPGEPTDDFLEEVYLSLLPTCLRAEDRPEPCVERRGTGW